MCTQARWVDGRGLVVVLIELRKADLGSFVVYICSREAHSMLGMLEGACSSLSCCEGQTLYARR